MTKVLVVGGAGFIGSHMVKLLGKQGYSVTVLDDFSTGYRDAILCSDVIEGHCGDSNKINNVLSRGFDAVMHFASFIEVGESVKHPDKYYKNNLVETITLLNAMAAKRINKFIFSSTAATFGEPRYIPIDESHPQNR